MPHAQATRPVLLIAAARETAPAPSTHFDYGELPPEARQQARDAAQALHQLSDDDILGMLEMGRRLNAAHEVIGRDLFQPWLKAEFRWKQSTASNWMRAAAVFPRLEFPGRFVRGALYALARDGVPAEARAEAIRRAREGERISQQVALAIIRRALGLSDSREKPSLLDQLTKLVEKLRREPPVFTQTERRSGQRSTKILRWLFREPPAVRRANPEAHDEIFR